MGVVGGDDDGDVDGEAYLCTPLTPVSIAS